MEKIHYVALTQIDFKYEAETDVQENFASPLNQVAVAEKATLKQNPKYHLAKNTLTVEILMEGILPLVSKQYKYAYGKYLTNV